MANPSWVLIVEEKAWKRPAKLSPTSMHTGQARSTPHQDRNTWNGASTSRNTPQVDATRKTTNSSCAATMSATASGEAVIA